MSRQAIASGFFTPVYVNEAVSNQAIAGAPIYIDSTGGPIWGFQQPDILVVSGSRVGRLYQDIQLPIASAGGSSSISLGFQQSDILVVSKSLVGRLYQDIQVPIVITPVAPVVTPTAPDPWYPDKKTPYYPDRKHYNQILENLKKREKLRWEQLTQTQQRRLQLRAAIETVVYGEPEPSEVVRPEPVAKQVIAVAKDLGVSVHKRDYDFVIKSIREYDRRRAEDLADEEDIEFLLLHI